MTFKLKGVDVGISDEVLQQIEEYSAMRRQASFLSTKVLPELAELKQELKAMIESQNNLKQQLSLDEDK